MSVWGVVRRVAHATNLLFQQRLQIVKHVFERSDIVAWYILEVVGSLKQRERQESKGSFSFSYIQSNQFKTETDIEDWKKNPLIIEEVF